MAYFKDLREYVKAVEGIGKLVRIKRKINKDTELQPLMRLQYRGLPPRNARHFCSRMLPIARGKTTRYR